MSVLGGGRPWSSTADSSSLLRAPCDCQGVGRCFLRPARRSQLTRRVPLLQHAGRLGRALGGSAGASALACKSAVRPSRGGCCPREAGNRGRWRLGVARRAACMHTLRGARSRRTAKQAALLATLRPRVATYTTGSCVAGLTRRRREVRACSAPPALRGPMVAKQRRHHAGHCHRRSAAALGSACVLYARSSCWPRRPAPATMTNAQRPGTWLRERNG